MLSMLERYVSVGQRSDITASLSDTGVARALFASEQSRDGHVPAKALIIIDPVAETLWCTLPDSTESGEKKKREKKGI